MKYIFLDTNVYLACALMFKKEHDVSLLQRLNECLDANDARLLLPEVVKAELERNIEVKWQWLRQSLLNYEKAVADGNPLASMKEPSVEKAIEQIRKAIRGNLSKRQSSIEATRRELEEVFSDDGKVEVIELTPQAMTRAMVMTLSRTGASVASSDMYGKPAEKQAKAIAELRFKYGLEGDCLILASLVEFANSRVNPAANKVVFCSSDGVFANDTRDDMDSSIRALFDSDVVFYSRLDDMLDAEFKVKSDARTKDSYEQTLGVLREFQETVAVNLAATAALPHLTLNLAEMIGLSDGARLAAKGMLDPAWHEAVSASWGAAARAAAFDGSAEYPMLLGEPVEDASPGGDASSEAQDV